MVAVSTPHAVPLMDNTLDLAHPFSDPRDDFRKGFVAAVTHLRGQFCPTQLQLRAALDVLIDFRLQSKVAVPHLPGRPVCGEIAGTRHSYGHKNDSPTSSSWAPRKALR